MDRSTALQRLRKRHELIAQHLAKLAAEPDSWSADHWRGELRNWLREMEEALPHVGKKTGEIWHPIIEAYRQAISQ